MNADQLGVTLPYMPPKEDLKMGEEQPKLDLKTEKFGKFSYIDEDEEMEAKRFIEEQLGFEVPRVTGFNLAIKLHVKEELATELRDDHGNKVLGLDGKPIVVATPPTMAAHEKYRQCVGLVLNKGPDAYVGERFKNSGPWCRIGDWVTVPRTQHGSQIMYRGIPVLIIPDDKVLMTLEDPEHVRLY